MRLPSLVAVTLLFIVSTLVAQDSAVLPAAPRTSPFDAIYIADGGTITVTVGDLKGRLLRVAGTDAERLVIGVQIAEGDRWKKRIAEDLGDALEAVAGTRPGEVVSIVIETEDGEQRTVEARFDAAKRARIYSTDYGDGLSEGINRGEQQFSPEMAQTALRLAAQRMNTYWSYRHTRPDVDVDAELLKLVPAEGSVPFYEIAEGTAKVLAMFPDGHAGVGGLANRQGSAYLPAMAVWLGGERVGLLQAADGLTGRPLDPQRPYLVAIDDKPLTEWIVAARRFAPTAHSGSDWHAIELLRLLPMLRRELGLEQTDSVQVTLATADGNDSRTVELELTDRIPPGRPRPWLARAEITPFNVEEPY